MRFVAKARCLIMSLGITKSHFVLDWGNVLPPGAYIAYCNDHIEASE